MPHQCLKCGKVFPSGSPEILKGCNECGGKKFFYTEQAVSEEERERLIEQANKDIKVLIREVLSQSQRDSIKTYDSEGQEVPVKPGKESSEWVKVSPEDVQPKAEDEQEIKAIPKHPSVKAILEQLKEKAGAEIEVEGSAEHIETAPAKTRPRKKGKVKLKRKPGRKKRKPRPEVITMVEPGVYDISLTKLLKGFPIIINKDGTYLVHLPSIFESMEKDKKEK